MMWKTKLLVVLMLVALAVPAIGAATGDPLDSNDFVGESNAFSESGCADFWEYPNCQPCWTQCLFAIMCDIVFDGTMEWGW